MIKEIVRLVRSESLVCGFLGHDWRKSDYIRVKECGRCRALKFENSVIHSPSPREKENQE